MDADTAFCGDCDSLVASSSERPPAAGGSTRAESEPPPELSSAPAPHVPVVPSRTIDCWSCDTPNKPSRMFCVSCGSFIAIGSKTKPTEASEPFSGPPPVPGDADADVSLPFVDGVPPLGSYSLEAQRRATRRTRTLTAVTSAVLAMVVGGAALYLASPLSDRGSEPETAAVVAPTNAPQPTDQTGAVSGISIQPEALDTDVATEPADVVELEPIEELAIEALPDLQPLPEAEPVSEPEPVAALEPVEELAVEPVADLEPLAPPESEPDLAPAEASVAQPDPVVEAEPVTGSTAVGTEAAGTDADSEPASQPDVPVDLPDVDPESVVTVDPRPDELATGSDPAAAARTATLPANDEAEYDGGWVCSEQVVIDDRRVRDWSISRVSFRVRDDFERVVLHLDRAGSGSGDPPSITADSMGSWKVQETIPGTERPGLGRRAVTLQLDDGFSGSLGLRAYRPAGLDVIKEFSVYPAGRDGRNVVISADTDGCYRVRVPAWSDPSGSLRRAEIHVDIQP